MHDRITQNVHIRAVGIGTLQPCKGRHENRRCAGLLEGWCSVSLQPSSARGPIRMEFTVCDTRSLTTQAKSNSALRLSLDNARKTSLNQTPHRRVHIDQFTRQWIGPQSTVRMMRRPFGWQPTRHVDSESALHKRMSIKMQTTQPHQSQHTKTSQRAVIKPLLHSLRI